MRTTLEINDALFVQAKTKAAEEGVSLRQIVENALRGYLAGRPPRRRYKFRGGTDSGKLLPGIDLADRNSLFDVMEGRK
jgi:hypothetical protein